MTDKVTRLRADPIEAMKGPVPAGHRVIVEGRVIPGLTMLDEGDTVHLILDGRLSIDVPREVAEAIRKALEGEA